MENHLVPVVIGTLINFNTSTMYDLNNNESIEEVRGVENDLYAILKSGEIDKLKTGLLFKLVDAYISRVHRYDFVADELIKLVHE